jgi:hypothetical protein
VHGRDILLRTPRHQLVILRNCTPDSHLPGSAGVLLLILADPAAVVAGPAAGRGSLLVAGLAVSPPASSFQLGGRKWRMTTSPHIYLHLHRKPRRKPPHPPPPLRDACTGIKDNK